MANRTEILKVMKKIFMILVLGFVFLFLLVMNSCKSDGMRSFYCLSGNKCVTVLKSDNENIYIIYGMYKNREKPSDNYIKMSNNRYSNIHMILSKDGKLLIDIDKNATIVKQSSNGLIELYKENKVLNDSLYTYFDGKYNRYKKEVDFISINIQENYATDKDGKKIE